MSDRMTPIPFGKIMTHILTESEYEGTVYGVKRLYKVEDDKRLPIFGETIEMPFGPAAGPNTQLAQNIIAAYAAGSRFFELKTVQTLDGEDLPVSKPCINAEDEGYNVEWSTELTVRDAFNEYVKAWFALKLISRQLKLGSDNGFVFNMSVGYDLEGIKSEKIDSFIEGLKDASNTDIFRECKEWALNNLDKLPAWDKRSIEAVSPNICKSITLSTLHGCPPEEIERISAYLLAEKKLHTFIKLNPTLLGFDFARMTLNDMGYSHLKFDDHHFKNDLQYDDAIPMIKKLLSLADEQGLTFGVKLTNTLPLDIANDELPGEEMYMSGKALYPLTTALAYKLSKEFKGTLRISYSGGADAFNINRLFECGIWPITVATTILKPGGYMRCYQIARELSKLPFGEFRYVDTENLKRIAENAIKDKHHVKPVKPLPRRKLDSKVPLFQCFTAPCRHGCPIDQDVPEYIELSGKGKNKEALNVILQKNPLPFITGTICAHFCQDKCSRNYYEGPVLIRSAKLNAAVNGFEQVLEKMQPVKKGKKRAAVIGGGPAGISAAFFLAREGVNVTLFEKRASLGGIVRYVIPEFRIPSYAVDNDVKFMEKLGVDVKLNTEAPPVKELFEQGFDSILFATGAWVPGYAPMKGEQINVIDFLYRAKNEPDKLDLGKNVVIIGGGNTAMDAARAAKRVKGVENVRIVYRRTKKYMPADEEELELAAGDGVEFLELLSPVEHKGGTLVCRKTVLGSADSSGRRTPLETDETVNVEADTVIAAVGEKVDTALFESNGIALDERGRPIIDEKTGMTNIPGVYVAGDALRGPATVVEAIADARRYADSVKNMLNHVIPDDARAGYESSCLKKGILREPGYPSEQHKRCLVCPVVCEICADVCPNRANIAIKVPGKDMREILHIDIMCNYCGNCATFCPYDSAPYKEKFTLFRTEKEFEGSDNAGFVVLDRDKRLVRVRPEIGSETSDYDISKNTDLDKEAELLILTVFEEHSYLL